VNNILEFFRTDWAAMTGSDWTGLVIVIILFALMAGLYFWIFKPSNKADFEQYRDFVNDDDEDREVGHGQTR
jgi:cbb3-type cytochrome oxidase subunit 3